MKHYIALAFAIMTLFTLSFLVVDQMQLPILTDPSPWLEEAGPWAALIGILLLMLDILFPIPASLIMVVHGSLFGLWLGAFVSLIGNLLATWLGFAIGRYGGSYFHQTIPFDERCRAEQLLAKWGTLGILATRSLPLIAESVAVIAGTSKMKWSSLTLATVLGALPASFLYALTGATAFTHNNFLVIFGSVMVITSLFWLVGRRIQARSSS